MRLMAALILTTAIVMPVSAASVKDGVDAWQKGDYSKAVTIWRPLADQGDPDAAFNLAQAYKLGRGVSPDLGQAKGWYGKAAQGGHPQAAANYGLLLFQDGDRKAAMPWIVKASDAGDPRAQYVYGTALFNGDLAGKDWPRAYALMTRSAATGLPQATTSLSQMDRYMSQTDRQQGLQIAARMTAQTIPPTNRLAGNTFDFPPQKPIARPGDLSATSPIMTPAPAASTKPVPMSGPRYVVTPRPKPVLKPSAVSAAVSRPSSGRWQIQLGAYGSQAAASAAWDKISVKLGLRPTFARAGNVFRLRAGPLADRAGAEKACTLAKTLGAACFPVAP